MKIAIVHPRLDRRGGAESVVLWMARGLMERGHEVIVATDRFSPERWGERDWQGVPLATLTKGAFDWCRGRAARKRAPGRQLQRVLSSCESIVAHNSPSYLWTAEAARRLGAQTVWFCEEPPARLHWRQTMPTLAAALDDLDDHPWLRGAAPAPDPRFALSRRRRLAIDRRIEREAVAVMDLILGNSAFTAKNATRIYGVAAVECALGLPEPARVNPAGGEPYVAWITSPIPHKNAHGFLEAIRIAVHDLGVRDLRVRAVGLRDAKLETRVAELGLEATIARADWLSDDELNRMIAGCRLLAYPSIDEPFGLVPLHAMAHGRPVIASSVGGPSETVVHEVTGLHFDPLNPLEMADRLCELWESPDRCDVLGEAGRQRYQERFQFDHFLDRFERLVVSESRVS